jgi:pimeloyl-ACP methyl ester carboxylesterase
VVGVLKDVGLHHVGRRREDVRDQDPVGQPPTRSTVVRTSGREDGGLLFIHGRGSNQLGYTARAEEATRKLDLTCLTFDLGGHGQSTVEGAELTLKDHLADVIAAYDWLRAAANVDRDRIGVCGASYGGHLACLLLGSRQVKRLLLRAPAQPSEDALRNLRAFEGSTLILESGADEIVPQAIIEKYRTAASTSKHVVIPGATHVLDREEWRMAFISEIIDWFKDL